MPSAVVFVLDILIVMLLITIINIAFLNAPVWLITIPLTLLGLMFVIWLIQKINDMRN